MICDHQYAFKSNINKLTHLASSMALSCAEAPSSGLASGCVAEFVVGVAEFVVGVAEFVVGVASEDTDVLLTPADGLSDALTGLGLNKE